jgi:hypothetical protein
VGNAAWYLAEGDWSNAVLCGAAILPVAGQGTTAVKLVKRGTALMAKGGRWGRLAGKALIGTSKLLRGARCMLTIGGGIPAVARRAKVLGSRATLSLLRRAGRMQSLKTLTSRGVLKWADPDLLAMRLRAAARRGMSRGAQLRAKYGAQFGEYSRFRGQGLTPTQSKYLTRPYRGMGHHFVGRTHGLPSMISESPLNVMKPKGISIGRFYERHFMADRHFFAARFPKSVGGAWSGTAIGLQKPGLAGRLWYGGPAALKTTAGAGAAAGGGGALYWWLSSDKE